MIVTVYINFNGNCRDAVQFYAEVFNTDKPEMLIPLKSITHSGNSRSPFPLRTDQPYRWLPITSRSEATLELN
jgi:hypothetical protein